jgi:hypothetical protein
VARLRIGGASFDLSASSPRLRIGGASFDGSLPATGRLRIGGASFDGTVAVILNPLTPATVEPLSTVSLTAVVAAGSATPDSYTWRVVSGAPVSLIGTGGATVTFAAPAHENGTYTVIGVKGINGGVQSPEQTVRIDALPQLHWLLDATGSWIPRESPVFL